MAGPEDSTSASSHHHHRHHHHHHHHHHHGSGSGHGQPQDPLRLPGDDVVSEQDCELADRLLDNLKPHGTDGDRYEDNSDDTATSAMRPGDENLRIDFRNGNGIKRTSAEQTDQASGHCDQKDSGFSDTSDPCERKISTHSTQSDSDSVFGSADTHEHMFFIEADDEDDNDDNELDDDDDDDDDNDGDDEYSVQIEDDVSENEKERRIHFQDIEPTSPRTTSSTNSPTPSTTDVRDKEAEGLSEDSSDQPSGVHQAGLRRSPPRPIMRRSSTSNMVTVCRHSHSSQLVVRCQMTHADETSAASCPAFFSPRWTDVMALTSRTQRGAASGATPASERRRRYTVGSKRDQQQQLQRSQQAMQDDPRRPGFIGRGRSYSDSDVQRLLMMEVGQELRRISDQFHFDVVKRGKLTTVSESTSEEDFGPEV